MAVVVDWVDRTDLAARVPDFITLAEVAINRKLRGRDQLTVATLTVNAERVSLPADCQQIENAALTTNPERPLKYATPEKANELKASFPAAGVPRYYTLVGRQARFVPVPDATYSARIEYYQSVLPLSVGSPTNWLLQRAPDVYLQATLAQAYKFLRDAEGQADALTSLGVAMEAMRIETEAANCPTTPRMSFRPIS
ncbi:MAG: hypothetical protein ACK53L_25100 [Pirellulaceae bacterium]